MKVPSFISVTRFLFKSWLAAFAALACSAMVSSPAIANNDYPARAVTIVVAWPAGSSTDSAARIIAERLSKKLGQSVVVDNRAGANGAIGTAHVAGENSDGYTLIFATADTHSINPHLYDSLKYDALKDFEPITLVGTVSFVLMQRKGLPYKNFLELVNAAKDKPNSISYGTWGIGSTSHLGFASIEESTGINLLHVPFQGAAPALNALLGAHVDLMLTSAASAKGQREKERVDILAVGGEGRNPILPDVATFSEQGFPEVRAESWYGLLAPRGIPESVRDRLSSEVREILKEPDVIERIQGFGWTVVDNSPADFDAFLRAEYKRYGTTIRARNISVQ